MNTDEVRDRGSSNRESQYSNQGLLVRPREAQLAPARPIRPQKMV